MTVAGELDKMAAVSLHGRENREGHGEAPRAAAPSSASSFLRPRTPWSSSSSSSSSSRPPSSCSRWRCATAAWQAALHLRVHASCPDLLHVLAARDELKAPVVVVCVCITLCLSRCGSLWWCGVCRRGRSEWRSECAVTFHRVCMVWGHVRYDSKHSDSPGTCRQTKAIYERNSL